MYDQELALEILKQTHQATQTILKRFSNIQAPKDFIDTDAGQERLDSICMLLIAIGESLKNLDKITLHSLLPCYPQIDWKKAKAIRDVISHHYFDLNNEVVYNVCKEHLPLLENTLNAMIQDIKKVIQQ